MSRAILFILFVPGLALGEVYRCDTPQGVVFSDMECQGAEVVEIADHSAGLGVSVPHDVRADLEVKRLERERRRYAARLYNERDQQIEEIDSQMAVLRRERATAANNLAGATYAAGIDARLGELQRARAGVAASYRDTITAASLDD